MRLLRRALVVGVTVAVLAPFTGAVAAGAAAPVADQQQPSCGDPRSADFPLGTRIHGAPGTYQPGGDSAEWYVDLANATAAACHDIHPVLVLVDRGRKLRPDHVRAEVQDAGTEIWHAIPFVRTDRDELIGVFGEGLPGFTVGADSTLSVRVRLGFAGEARRNTVVANTAVVQRKGNDGEWVGESGDYRFDIDPDLATGGNEDAGVPGESGEAGESEGRDYSEGAGGPAELAQSGMSTRLGRLGRPGLGGLAVACFVGGGALVVGSRRVRTAGER